MKFVKIGGKKSVTMISKPANMNAYMYGPRKQRKKGRRFDVRLYT